MNILVVDDDPELGELLSEALTRDGHLVRWTKTKQEADESTRGFADLVVLDIGLPDGSGIDLCRKWRSEGYDIPVMLLTAQSSVPERVRGLDAGADDYVLKPFALAELRSRVKALGRRRVAGRTFLLEREGLKVDFIARRATVGQADVGLTPFEWKLLEVLASSQGRVVPRPRLHDEISQDSDTAGDSSLEVLVGRIRRKLGRSVIRTVRGQGYVID